MSRSSLEIVKIIYRNFGHNYHGENISQISHAVQCYRNARKPYFAPYGPSFPASCFLHDIDRFFIAKENEHGFAGSNFLASLGFHKNVYMPIYYHTMAKKFLVEHYGEEYKINKESERTMKQQSFSQSEYKLFRESGFFLRSIALRGIDDLSKDNIEPCVMELEEVFKYFEENKIHILE